MPSRPAPTRRRLLGLPLWVSLGLHGVVLVGLTVLLGRRGAASEGDQVLAQLRFQIETTVLEHPSPLAEPPAPEPDADPEPLGHPVDALPDLVPPLPPEPTVEEDDLPYEGEAQPAEIVPLLPVHEIPLSAVQTRPAPPRLAPTPLPPAPAPTPVLKPAPRPARRALQVLHQPDPLQWYPALARQRGIQGTALIRIVVDDRGVVVDAQVKRSSGSDLLDRQAVRVGYAYRFAPGAAGPADLPVRFRLD